MKIRVGAVVAMLVAASVLVVAIAGVSAFSADRAPSAGASVLLERPGPTPAATGTPVAASQGTATERSSVAPTMVPGIASTYAGTAGWIGQATVALPGDLGGRYTGQVNGHVTVCADRCARLPVVDWCQCYWGTADQRVVDLSHAAWPLVTDAPLAQGLVEVRVVLVSRPTGPTNS